MGQLEAVAKDKESYKTLAEGYFCSGRTQPRIEYVGDCMECVCVCVCVCVRACARARSCLITRKKSFSSAREHLFSLYASFLFKSASDKNKLIAFFHGQRHLTCDGRFDADMSARTSVYACLRICVLARE